MNDIIIQSCCDYACPLIDIIQSVDDILLLIPQTHVDIYTFECWYLYVGMLFEPTQTYYLTMLS